MDRFLAALVLVILASGPASVQGHGVESAAGRFDLAQGVIGGTVAGEVGQAFVAAGSVICFLPGTFDTSVEGLSPGDLQPTSNCGYDATVRIDGLAGMKAGDAGARSMVVNWTDLAGRSYTLRFEADAADSAQDVRVICLGATSAGCHSAFVDSSPDTLVSWTGVSHDTGPRARLAVTIGPGPADASDLGVYDVPFTLTIESL